MHEIITLQLGSQANYVGTHYWNAQESYFTYNEQDPSPVDHNVSFRPGRGADGSDTYSPRTLIYDLKGAFGSLKRENALYELQNQPDPIQQNAWGRDAMSLRLPPIEPSLYQQALDAGTDLPALTTQSVRFWSDYNHIFYHPRSIVQLNEYELNSSLMPFERYGAGDELFTNLDREHDLLDRDLRPFLEECDQLQGIQIFSGTDDAWGGFTARYLERVADELGKGSRWVFALEEGRSATRERKMLQLSNAAQSLYSVVPSASMYVPLSNAPARLPSYLSMDASSPWHTSALQAALIETTTSPARLKDDEVGRASFDELEATLSRDGKRPILEAALSASDPTKLSGGAAVNGDHDRRLANGANGTPENDADTALDIAFMPDTPRILGSQSAPGRPKTYTKIYSTRGAWKSSLEIQDANLSSRDRYISGVRTTIHQSALLLPQLPSYPKIFQNLAVEDKLAIMTSLSTSTKIAKHVRGMAGFAGQSYLLDEREAVYDGLVSMAEEYEEGFEDLSSEESDDD